VLGAAEADPLGAEVPRLGGIVRGVGVCTYLQPAELVGPAEDRLEVLVDLGRDERNLPDDHLARAAVDRQGVPFGQRVAADAQRAGLEVDRQALAAGDAGLSHAASDDGCMGGHAAVGGQDPARLDQAVDVVGRGLPADEDHALAGEPSLLGKVGVEHDAAAGRAGRGVQALRGDLELG